jgi:hypothetical protein
MLKTEDNPGGVSLEVFDGLRAGTHRPLPALQGPWMTSVGTSNFARSGRKSVLQPERVADPR